VGVSRGALNLEKSYNFVEKRPVIDEMRTLIDHASYSEIANDTHVSRATLRNWFSGKTISPKTQTVNKVLARYGKRLGIVDL
jgi:DNA invertase Pin-like site-specific DNA recombinase